MAEYKTYTCDICGEQKALHFTIPSVDKHTDPVDGHISQLPGYVDLCERHAQNLINTAVRELSLTTEQQRRWWKSCLQK